MITVDNWILKQLAQSDSATVQNAGILVRGCAPAEHDYSGTALKRMLPEFGTLVGYAMTAELVPLHADRIEKRPPHRLLRFAGPGECPNDCRIEGCRRTRWTRRDHRRRDVLPDAGFGVHRSRSRWQRTRGAGYQERRGLVCGRCRVFPAIGRSRRFATTRP